MKIANADKLINHFENTIAVHLFTTAEIITIIETFSFDIPEETKMILPRGEAKDVTYTNLKRIMDRNTVGGAP